MYSTKTQVFLLAPAVEEWMLVFIHLFSQQTLLICRCLTFRPVICAVCGISSSLPASAMMDVTAVQLNLHSQGPPTWRLGFAGSVWFVESGSHHPQRDCEEGNWWGWNVLALLLPSLTMLQRALHCVLVRAQKDGSDCPWKATDLEFPHGLHSSVRSERCAVLVPKGLLHLSVWLEWKQWRGSELVVESTFL